jgi:hypothetical protein
VIARVCVSISALPNRARHFGGSGRNPIDEKFPPRANVRYPISGKAKAKKKKAKRKKGKRTVLYSSKGKKLYAVRSADGKFKDIQSYQRAHSMDIKRNSADGN